MNIHPIETGFFSTDGSAMFGLVPQKVWSSRYLVDAVNRCPLSMRVFYVDLGKHKVLFDTGIGEAKVKGMAHYQFHHQVPLCEGLSRYGINPEAITDVVLSHLHFDHCGGSVRKEPNGLLVPAFPNAVYWASLRQRENTFAPSLWESDAYAPSVVEVLEKAGRLRLVNRDESLFEGVSVALYQGHTDDQLVAYVETDQGLVVVGGDVVPMAPHLIPLCIAGVDNSAQVAVEEKRRLLQDVVEKQALLVFYHDVQTQAVRLTMQNKRVSIKERVTF